MSSLRRLLLTLACVFTAQAQAESDLVAIPAGTFAQGNSFANEGSADELPARTVTLPAFRLGRTEVTWQQWQDVRAWAVANGYTDLADKGYGRAADHPVISVSWHDAVKWCNARSEREGLVPVYYTSAAQDTVYRTGTLDLTAAHVRADASGYRLPTEAEWERAARGGVPARRFPWGDSIDHTRANYFSSSADSYDVNAQRDRAHPTYAAAGWPFTAPAAAFAANAYGLHGMAGNAPEWCWDRYSSTAYTTTPALAPTGPASGTHRVLRGGGWDEAGSFQRVAHRDADRPASPLHGFRVAQNLADQAGAPVIVQGPLDASVALGETVALSVVATGTGPLAYAWTRDGVTLSGATDAQLVFAASEATFSGVYRVTVSNATGTATSDGAIVSIDGHTSYAAWALGLGLLSPEPLADPDSDGLNNLLEFALGLDPEQADAQPLTLRFTTDGGTDIYAFADLPYNPAAIGVSLDVQMTNALTNWDALPGSMIFHADTTDGQRVWRTFRSAQPCGPNDLPRFFRARASR